MKLLRGLPKYFSLITRSAIFIIFFFCLFAFKTQLIAKEFSIAPNDTSALINAINEANNNSEANIINLATSSAHTLTEAINNPSFDPTYSTNGLPLITSELVINGNNSIIARDTSSSRFRIFAIQFPGKLTLNNITIKNGFSEHPAYGGGGILNLSGVLIINNSVISKNVALIGGGAGIWAQGGSSYVFNTTISENNSGNHKETISSGGAFVKRGLGLFKVTDSIIANNEAETIGGAIYSNATSSGEIIIENSLLLNNSTRLQGGAIYNYQGKINITNSCISGNLPNAVINETVSSFIISAINNWWGHKSGPSGAGDGSGDYISNRVDYIPFLVSCPPLSSPSPTPTPTPTPTPEPTKVPVVVLPGLGGSWNTAAMIAGNNSGSWKKTPFVKIYDNLKETFLSGAGYTEGDNYFEFYYDWRKPLASLADTFKDYLNNTVPGDTKVNLVGHSMGGMVARTYAQKYGLDKINQIVTTGSPHEGTIKAWQGWSGAEIGDRWSWEWIGLQLYLQIHKDKYTSPVKAVRGLAPGLIDLSPIFNFAKNKNNQVISVANMNSFNNYLSDLKTSLSTDLKNLMTTISGLEQNNDYDTVAWIKLADRSLTDQLLGKWPDGKPGSYEYTTEGDLTVLKKSALIDGATPATVNASHVELVETSAGIQAILNALGITAAPVTNTSDLPRNPSLIFFLHSPANIQVTAPNGSQAGEGVAAPMSNSIYSAEDKLLVIYNASAGDYQIKITGTGVGSYQLEIGQLTKDGETWSATANNITTGKTDSYQLTFNPDKPLDNPVSKETAETYLKLAKFRLEQLKEDINKRNQVVFINQTIRLIDRALSYLKSNNFTLAEQYIQSAVETDYLLRQTVSQLSDINAAGEWLIKAFLKTDSQSAKPIAKTLADRQLSTADKLHNQVVSKVKAKISGENLSVGEGLSLAEEWLNQAQVSSAAKNYAETYIYSLVSRILSNEVLGLVK